jgi:hydroxyethylthiazole kinase
MLNVYNILEAVRSRKPLIHHITNWVTIYDCANITRVVGALPVMAHAREEVEDMTLISNALVLNIGTLTKELVESMVAAGRAANKKGIPVVLDAVGVGATAMRTDKSREILEKVMVNIIKGNASEIGKLAGAEAETRGVESMGVKGDLLEIARGVAADKEATVVVTGQQDLVVGRNGGYMVNNGHRMMGSIVGTGCMAASLIGSFAAVEKDYTAAATAALVCFGLAGELAGMETDSPGTYKKLLYDEVYNLGKKKIEKMQRFRPL